jgi:hypothetical protein
LKLSRLLGILSVVFLIIAILTVVLPLYSATRVSITSPQTGSSQNPGSIPTTYYVTNNGFLGIDGVYLDVTVLTPSGIQLYSVTTGPVDIPPGSTVTVHIATPNVTSFSSNVAAFSGLTSVDLAAKFTVNLGGLIPISATADFKVPINSTSPAP